MKKLYIRTFGCQMNEYDSDKMADVLGAADSLTKTDNPEEADIILFNTCSVREKAQERVFHDLGARQAPQATEPESDHRCGRLRGEPGGRCDRPAGALCRRGIRAADLAPPAKADCRAQAVRAFAGGYLLPRDREVRQPPAAKVEGATAFVSIMEGCSKYCTFASCPIHEATRSIVLLATSSPRSRAGRARGEGSDPPWPECERLAGVDVAGW